MPALHPPTDRKGTRAVRETKRKAGRGRTVKEQILGVVQRTTPKGSRGVEPQFTVSSAMSAEADRGERGPRFRYEDIKVLPA